MKAVILLALAALPVFAVAPTCVLKASAWSVKAGTTMTWDASGSTPNDGGSLSYSAAWVANAYLARPSTPSITGSTTATPSATLTGFGGYTLEMTVTNSISMQSASCKVTGLTSAALAALGWPSNLPSADGFGTVGSVPTVGSTGKVDITALGLNAGITDFFPHQLIFGFANTTNHYWGYQEYSRKEFLDLQITRVIAGDYADVWNTPATGTVDLGTGTSVVGHGTSFTTEVCQGPGSPTVPKADYVSFWIPSLYRMGATGRTIATVASCTDNTHLTLAAPDGQASCTGMTCFGIQFSVYEQQFFDYGYGRGGNPFCYYDACVLANWAMYVATGIDTYYHYAKELGTRWISQPYINYAEYTDGSGDGQFYFQRNQALTGMWASALDDGPSSTLWAPLGRAALFNFTTYNGCIAGNCNTVFNDIRETSYTAIQVAACALYHPTPATKASCQTDIAAMVAGKYTTYRYSAGTYKGAWVALTGGESWVAGIVQTGKVTNGSDTVTDLSFNPQTACGPSCVSRSFWAFPTSSTTTGFSDGDTDFYYIVDAPTSSTAKLDHAYTGTGMAVTKNLIVASPTFTDNRFQIVTISVTNGSPNFTVTSGDLSGSNCHGSCTLPTPLLIFVPSDANNLYYYLGVDSATTGHFYTDQGNANYTGMTGSVQAIISPGQVPAGYGIQPFFEGIAATAMDWASRACSAAGLTTCATNAASYVQDAAVFIRDIGYQGDTVRGIWYSTVWLNCRPASAPGCFQSDSIKLVHVDMPNRGVTGEAINVDALAFPQSLDASFKTNGDFMFAGLFARDSGDINYDSYYAEYFESTTSLDGPSGITFNGPPCTVGLKVYWKCAGYYWGIGGGYAWPAVRLLVTPAPTLTSLSPASGNLGRSTTVTLTGTSFVNGATTVDAECNSCSVNGLTISNIIFNSATSLTATFTLSNPVAGLGTYNISVTTPNGTSLDQTWTANGSPMTGVRGGSSVRVGASVRR